MTDVERVMQKADRLSGFVIPILLDAKMWTGELL